MPLTRPGGRSACSATRARVRASQRRTVALSVSASIEAEATSRPCGSTATRVTRSSSPSIGSPTGEPSATCHI